MKRRSLLASLGAAALAGCSQLQSQSGGSDPDSQWPSNSVESSPESVERDWYGGNRDANMTGGVLVLDNVKVEMLGASAAQQVGVSTSETDQEIIERIPESEFEWYSASENAYIWFVYLNFLRREGREMEVPDADLWRAQSILSDGQTPVQSFTSSFDPDPTYYRLPGLGVEYTQPAYKNLQQGNDLQSMVFEVESDAIDLIYGDPTQATYNYSVQ